MRISAAACVFLIALALCAGLTKRHATSWNDASRLATVDALVSERTFAIDRSPFAAQTGDKIRVRGRTFSDKPPLLAVLGAGVGLALQPFGVSLRRTPATAIYLVTLLTVGVCFALGCTYAFLFQLRLGFGRAQSAAVAAATGLGSLALPYATVLANHVPAGAAGLAGAYYLTFERERVRGLVLGALFLTLAYAFDPGAVVLAVLAVVLLYGLPARRWALFALAMLPVVIAQIAYNLDVTGSALPPIFNASVWQDRSLPLYLPPSTPVVALYSAADYTRFAFDLVLGSKGLFVFTPLAAVCAYGLVLWWKERARRRLALAIAASAAALLVLMVVFQNDETARNFGERRYVDIAFVGCTPLGVAFAAVRTSAAALAVRIALGASVVISALGTVAPFGGRAGENGLAYAAATFATIVQTKPLQAVTDLAGMLLLLGGLLWLTRGAFERPPAAPGTRAPSLVP